MNVKSSPSRHMALAAIAAIVLSIGNAAIAGSVRPPAGGSVIIPKTSVSIADTNGSGSGSSSKDGQACQVTVGPNKGKTGTYTNGGSQCTGPTGDGGEWTSNCTDSVTGASRCADAITTGPVRQLSGLVKPGSFSFVH
jgi:hypothetical protein